MNDLLTFFRNRQQDCGKEWRIKIELQEGVCFLLFYSKKDLDENFYIEKINAKNQAIYTAFKANLRNSMRESGGGLLVEEKPACDSLDVVISILGAGDYFDPPKAIYYIEYGGYLYERAFTEDALRLPLAKDAHIILPVDAVAECHFRSFREHYSSWFPTDFETNMLNLLRRPSLDLRIERLERIITERDSLTGNDTAAFNPPFSNASWGGVILVVAILLSSILYPYIKTKKIENNQNASTVSEQQENHTGIEANQASGVEQASGINVPTLPPKTDQGLGNVANVDMDLQNAIKGLLNKLKSKRDTGNPLRKIESNYFKNIDIGQLNAETAKAILSDKNFLWGVIKLHAIIAAKEAGTSLSSDKFLDSSKELTNTVEIFSELYNNNAYPSKSDIDFPCWLDFITHQIDNTGKLKQKFIDKNPWLLSPTSCTLITPDQVPKQIEKLTSRLSKLPD